MSKPGDDPLAYYAKQGLTSDPREHAYLFDNLPSSIPELCRVVQGLLIHIFWVESYGVNPPEERKQREVNVRHVARQLAQIREKHDGPLSVARPPQERQMGNCRHFATLLCAMLRHQGVPARARCGFGAYFEPGRYVDHWVCEYWRADEQRWVMVDAQIDGLQSAALQINFDPCDMPPGRFLTGGTAWQLCRAREVDPDLFGIFDLRGLWFVRGDMLRDLASLNKVELLPWDSWGLLLKEEQDYTPEDVALLDRVAALTLSGNESFDGLRTVYEEDDRLRVPPVIRSFATPAGESVDVIKDQPVL